jgi:hypothetical protein
VHLPRRDTKKTRGFSSETPVVSGGGVTRKAEPAFGMGVRSPLFRSSIFVIMGAAALGLSVEGGTVRMLAGISGK